MTTDELYWLNNRAAILDAIEKAGFQLLSNKDGFWLASTPSALPVEGAGNRAAERATAEQAYTDHAYNYPKDPVGSRDWTLYYAGWLHRSRLASPAIVGACDCGTDDSFAGEIIGTPSKEGAAQFEGEREKFEAWAAQEWDGKAVPDAAWLGWKGRAASPSEGGGEVLGFGLPDWPEDLQTFAERKAYQRGVGDARRSAQVGAAPEWTEEQTLAAIKATASFGTVTLTSEYGPYDISRPTFQCDRLVEAIVAARDAQWLSLSPSRGEAVDAARYRWLRSNYCPPTYESDWDAMDRALMNSTPEVLDGLIDAAIQSQGAKP